MSEISKTLSMLGQKVTVYVSGEEKTCSAIIYPYLKSAATESIGQVGGDRSKQLMAYIGDISVRLDHYPLGTILKDESGEKYRVVHAYAYRIKGAALYVRAVLQPVED